LSVFEKTSAISGKGRGELREEARGSSIGRCTALQNQDWTGGEIHPNDKRSYLIQRKRGDTRKFVKASVKQVIGNGNRVSITDGTKELRKKLSKGGRRETKRSLHTHELWGFTGEQVSHHPDV